MHKKKPSPQGKILSDEKLFAQMIRRPFMTEAWASVYRNQGAAGGDHITVERFALRAEMNIGILHNELKTGTYMPGSVRAVDIPKKRGGFRRLLIPCVRDRVVQKAVTNILTPYLDREFEDSSFAYRPGRSVNQAVFRIQALQQAGLSHVVEADIQDYFGSIPHDLLLSRLGESLSSGPLTQLVTLWLTHAAPSGRGIAQGSPLSPLLANLFLDRLDEAFQKKHTRIVRFADDFVILTASRRNAEDALMLTEKLLSEQGLQLNPAKTRVTDFQKGFAFLGSLFVRSMALKVSGDDTEQKDTEHWLRRIAQDDEKAEITARDAREEEQRAEAAGYAIGLRNLYVLEPGRRLSVRNQAFTVEEPVVEGDAAERGEQKWRELIAIPHQRIDRIDIGPEASATFQAQDHALATDTLLCFIDGHGATQGMLAGNLAPFAERHLAQAASCLDEEKRAHLARIIVEGRIRNQRALLRKLSLGRDTVPASVTRAITELTGILGWRDRSRIRHADTIARIMGYEGAASAVYWKALSDLAHPDFRFRRRERQKGTDASNSALDFLCWLLHRDVSAAVLSAGLHPGFGTLHSTSNRHDACIYDLMEEFRAHLVEGLFVYVTNRRILRPEMFVPLTGTAGSIRMTHEGICALVRAYEQRMAATIQWPRQKGQKKKRQSFRRLVISQAHSLARHHEHGETHQPFETDY